MINAKTRYIPVTIISMVLAIVLGFSISSCGIYSFNESKPIFADSIKTIKIDLIENHAPYVTPQLSPSLTQRLRQKIVNQTKLTETKNSNNADLYITGKITDYAVSTSGVSTTSTGRQQASINRLTVQVQITYNNQREGKTAEYTVSRSFDFSATQTLQAASANLLDEMVRNLADEIFNQIFSGW